MSGVYIKNMPMPKRCLDCWLCYDGLDCVALDESLEVLEVVDDFDRCDSRSSNCPLVAVPDHGDLIDRDALMFDTEERYCTGCDSYRGLRCRACWVDDMHGELVDAPVIIPAERSEE